jgi:glycosyltransferase involved in cell wall biosynthesis
MAPLHESERARTARTLTVADAGASPGTHGDSPAVWDGPDVVLVHDWIGGVHGAEQVLREFATLFPSAPILTLFADYRVLPKLGIAAERVHESYLGRVPGAVQWRRFLMPWFADAVQTLDVGDAALIVSSSHAVAKGVPHRSYQRHLAYVHSPMRYAHDLMPQYVTGTPRVLRPAIRRVLRNLAIWDVASAQRVTRYVGNSRAVAERIWRTYRRRAAVLHPPVDVAAIPLAAGARGDHYAVVSRLVTYKRIDLAIRAAAAVGRRLIIVGDGPERRSLESLAASLGAATSIEFTGWATDAQKYAVLGGARALLFPGEEDFGIVGVEALACGTPVIALGRGGMLDILGADAVALVRGDVVAADGGVLVGEQTSESLAGGIRVFENRGAPRPEACRQLAERFATPLFRRRMLELARNTLNRHVLQRFLAHGRRSANRRSWNGRCAGVPRPRGRDPDTPAGGLPAGGSRGWRDRATL